MGGVRVQVGIDAAFSQRPLVHICVYMCVYVCGFVCSVCVGVFMCVW